MPTSLALLTPPVGEPVELDDAKRHLKLEPTESAEDGLVRQLIKAAREYCEAYQGVSYFTTEWALYLDAFPAGTDLYPQGAYPWDWQSWTGGPILLPRTPVQSVDEVRYTQADGSNVVVPAADYVLDAAAPRYPARLLPVTGKAWPLASLGLQSLNGVRVTFTAGYGEAAEAVPEPARQAIRLLVAHWFMNRQGGSPVPEGVLRLLDTGSSMAYA